MNRHQVLTGAANSGDHCYAVGSVEGIHFTAYAAGCDIVILAGDFQRVQIIPGAVHGYIQVSCIDCCTDTGKIAASYGRKVCIFEPTPLLHHDSTHKLDYQWYHTGTLEAEYEVLALSWNQEGTRLLTAGEMIQMWQCPDSPDTGTSQTSGVEFFIEDEQEAEILEWQCVWRCHTATPVTLIRFSYDGLLFASLGKNDRLVKIWYENKRVQLPLVRTDSLSPKRDEYNYSFVYIAHPRAVTGFTWRKTSKYMPRASVANMLITSCRDNICRIWSETILPEDGLVDVQQLDPMASQSPMFHTQRHKKRFMQHLNHARHLMQKRKQQKGAGGPDSVPPLPSAQSTHDFHKFGIHPNSIAPGFHFHLAASINPDSDIPLLPAMGAAEEASDPNFVVHWLDNKEFHFSQEAEKILEEMTRKSHSHDDHDSGTEHSDHQGEPECDELLDMADASVHHFPGSSPELHSKPVTQQPVEPLKKKRSYFKKSRSYLSTESERSTMSGVSMATTHSSDGAPTVIENIKGPGTDPLDHKIEGLLREWHQSADMLFSIHPVDGSFLVWLVEWMDEPSPGSFRQVQISFSSRIPHAIPVGDAMSMSPDLLLYCNYGKMDLKTVLKESETQSLDSEKNNASNSVKIQANAMGKNSPGQNDNSLMPNVLMISKHLNGSLNQWQISFAEGSHFATVLNIAHASRTCGHRFQTNSAACHPVLPLLLTTSHHNVPDVDNMSYPDNNMCCSKRDRADPGPGGFCSELILWKVDSVGRLSKSGGVMELARINSPQVSAFANVSWIPTLLPSSTLGSLSNSPSALFVASDGTSLRVYQAVIDARTMLAELSGHRRKETINLSRSNSSTSSGLMVNTPSTPTVPHRPFNVVSLQSTSRPGCVIELDAIDDAKQDWKHLQLIHVFQEQLVCGFKSSPTGAKRGLEAMVDLQNATIFEEVFYLVVMEKLLNGTSVLHMWRLVISSQAGEQGPLYSSDTNFVQEGAEDTPNSSRSNTPEPPGEHQQNSSTHLSIHSVKVCTQTLSLPEGISVVSATVAAGHLSSSSIYPACFAPYLISTACSDGQVRFWRCKMTTPSGEESRHPPGVHKFDWSEWEMLVGKKKHSSIRVRGKPLTVSCAYSGRVAVAYRLGGIKNREDDPSSKYVNLCVSIYECESTGGAEWTLEDTIELKNITIPDPKIEIDLSRIYTDQFDSQQDCYDAGIGHHSNSQVIISPTMSTPAIVKTVAIPSLSTVQSIKRILSVKDPKMDVLKPRRLVQLDWVSMEDGSHILTVGVGSKILLYAAVSSEISHATKKEYQVASAGRTSRGILQKSKSMTVQNFVEEIRWMRVRSMELQSADGLPPLPMHVSWVRDGILVVGMDNEMHVYSQWRGPGEDSDSTSREHSKDHLDCRALTEQSLQKVSSSSSLNLGKSYKISQSMSSIKLDASISNLSMLAEKNFKDREKKRDTGIGSYGRNSKLELAKSDSTTTSIILNQDYGLFEAAHLANPVLPQYHPRQLLELLNFGKIRRVKAILAHLVRCISCGDSHCSDNDDSQQRQRPMTRGLTVTGPSNTSDGTTIPEDTTPDYIEISSIPPLPLYALLAADEDMSYANLEPGKNTAPTAAPAQDYNSLFDATNMDEDEEDDPFDNDSVFNPAAKLERKRSVSQMVTNPNHFGLSQSRLLARHLTHTHLPGLSSLDQMYLLALGDTVANTKLDFSEKNAPDVANKRVLDREHGRTEPVSTDATDDCGLRYLLASRHHIYLLNTLPMRQRVSLQHEGLSPAYFVWAFHSEAAEDLLNVLPNMQKGEPTWAELRQFGCGWWCKNINILRKCIEKVAKTAFQVKKDPLDAALFYLAMKKKTLLWGLFRSINDTKMMTFFRNNFAEDRWRKAALKNAFALLGRQRFQHAAAFFLLGGAVRDAIEVCLHKMDDLQLAIVIARLYESELDDSMPVNLKRILYEECLGCDQYGQNPEPSNTNPDPFVRSMAYWMLKDYSAALGTLLEMSNNRRMESNQEMESYSSNPSVFNFYNYLRTHPLLVRQHLAQSATDKSKSVFLSGFSKGNVGKAGDMNVTYVDRITPIERRLYFMTAHAHFKNGCPALALEVLSKLPDVIDMDHDITKSHSIESVTPKSPLDSGTLNITSGKASTEKSSDFDWSKPISNGIANDTIDSFDWSQPVSSSKNQTADSLDWSKPVSSTFTTDTADSFDWSQPVKKSNNTNLALSFEDADDSDTKSDSEIESREKLLKSQSAEHSEAAEDKKDVQGDIMAQQLKFVACLKIMMEELSTLATGFEVDGGQLRYQLYIWLEKEVDVLKQLCRYNNQSDARTKPPSSGKSSDGDSAVHEEFSKMSGTSLSSTSSSKPTLHEIILAEKMDFEAKLHRMAKRKQWLQSNQQLLRTLLSYSVLYGSSGGGLASVRMELILLLQELQQEKTQQQLLSPLPFPTTLPLLSASIASAKTVIADPIRHLQCTTQDLLHTIVEFRSPPMPGNSSSRVFALRNLAAALSACIYQCLCDSDSFVVMLNDNVDIGMEGFTSTNVVYKDSYLMAGAQRRRHISSTGEDAPNSAPAKWPGVASLRALLAHQQDDDAPKLNILLCEALISVHMSLLIHALTMYDANLLFRLVGHPFIEGMWPMLFGGGVKKLVKVQSQADVQTKLAQSPKDDASKQRLRLHMKVLGHSTTQTRLKENKPTYKEKFVPPELSIISYFMTKPPLEYDVGGVDYDSADSISSDEEDEEEEFIGMKGNDLGQMEHLDPTSYSWCLMRYAIVRYVRYTLVQFLPQIGVELPELPVCSPLVQAVLKTLEQWEEVLQGKLELFNGPPGDYIPGCFVDHMANGPTITKYKAMLEPLNTPFLSTHYSALPAKRLWHYLIHLKYLQEIFIRYIFKKRRPHPEDDTMKKDTTDHGLPPPCEDPMKILHKDQDSISAFCLNQYSSGWSSANGQQMASSDRPQRANLNCISIATQKEVVEMDITGILTPPIWLEDETEYDIESIRVPSPIRLESEEFLLVQTAADRQYTTGGSSGSGLPPSAPGAIPAPSFSMAQSGRGGSMIKGINIPGITNPNLSYYIVDRSRRLMKLLTKRPVPGVRRMGAHPHLPYYLTGAQDGSVRLWEWGHNHCITVARQPGSFPKVSKVLFNAQGNKFGVSDSEGSVCLWQVGLGVNMNKPYLNLKCHNKSTSDFVFVGSSSLLATAGHSSESRNVCLWDTLLPQRSSLIQAFHCHQDGSPCVLYAPQHQVLISAGKKGDICIFDVRQRQLRQTFQAHDSAIKTLALDPTEEFFVTGAADGDIKVWGLTIHNLVYSFPGEHCRGSIFRNTGVGVTQVHLTSMNHLFSCGADGSMKVRQLPQRDLIVHSLTSSTLSSS